MIFSPNKNSSRTLVQYVDEPQWLFSKIWNSNSCGHLIEHVAGKIQRNRSYCELHCSRSPWACSHARGDPRGRAQPPLPWPEPWEVEEKKKTPPGPPLSVSLLSARRRPPWPRQTRPTAPHRRDQAPPAREQGRPTRCRSTHVARAPAPASYWTPSPSTPWVIKTPADQTNERTPLPATSQTPSLLPARSRSTWPAPPARYWTRKEPPRSTSVEQADAGNWRRSAAGAFFARCRRALLPLRAPPSPLSSSLRAGELRPSPSSMTQTRRWIRIQRQRTDSGHLSDLTSRPHLSVPF
jgi:hypothetical protein